MDKDLLRKKKKIIRKLIERTGLYLCIQDVDIFLIFFGR